MDSLFVFLGFGFICAMIITANHQESRKSSNNLVKILLSSLVGIIALLGALTLLSALSPQENMPQLELSAALSFFLVAVLASLLCFGLIFSRSLRLFLMRHLIRSDGLNRHYQADSIVHTTALLLMAFLILNTVGNFLLGGGVEGLAESLQETSIGVNDLLLHMALYLTGALLGVGIIQRRSIKQTFQRLGLSFSFRENIKHILIGLFVGFGLFWVQVGMGIVWQALVSPETLAEQTAATEQIFAAFGDSLWLGFLVAFTASIGEELLFRGALQPIFGNLFVSIFFVLLHSQYLLTPATLIILVVSLVFGLLRQNYSTNASIVAHFVYNFSPFLMLYLASQVGISI